MTTVTLTSNGQVVIPKLICEQLHWRAGHELVVEVTAAGVLLTSKPQAKPLRLESLRGFLKQDAQPVGLEELCLPVDYAAEGAERGQAGG
jgi:AbrB family looped-hinge helix DNA binding protein